jgi:hypothetical protein
MPQWISRAEQGYKVTNLGEYRATWRQGVSE